MPRCGGGGGRLEGFRSERSSNEEPHPWNRVRILVLWGCFFFLPKVSWFDAESSLGRGYGSKQKPGEAEEKLKKLKKKLKS